MKYFIAGFLTSCALSALVAWLAGFNFDQRGPDVAITVMLTLIGAVFTGLWIMSHCE